MLFFSWLRAQARDAILAGINDAVAEMDSAVPQVTSSPVRLLLGKAPDDVGPADNTEDQADASKPKAKARR